MNFVEKSKKYLTSGTLIKAALVTVFLMTVTYVVVKAIQQHSPKTIDVEDTSMITALDMVFKAYEKSYDTRLSIHIDVKNSEEYSKAMSDAVRAGFVIYSNNEDYTLLERYMDNNEAISVFVSYAEEQD